MLQREGKPAPNKIIDDHSPSGVRTEERKWNNQAVCDERLGNAFVPSAAAAIAGNLRNIEHLQLRLGVLARVAHQFVRNLPRCRNPRIGKDAAPKGLRKIEFKIVAGEICEISLNKV